MRELVNTDAKIAELASRQYGVVAARQLVLDAKSISRRASAARLFRIHRGVYAVGHLGLGREARWLAAVLACGEDAVLSHRSAAALWNIRLAELFRPEVTCAGVRRHPEITTHRGRLAEADRTIHLGIPVTSPARTLADLGHILNTDELTRALREAMFRRLYDRRALEDALTRRPSKALRELLVEASVTQSQMEDRFLAICARHRLPRPNTQHPIGAKRYDFAWPDQRLVVETDGWLAHGTPYAFQADRSASNALQLGGWIVLRYTWADLTRRSRTIAATVRDALRARSASSAPRP
jgi:very-short-patch-repair endonuclease